MIRTSTVFLAVSMPFLVKQYVRMGKENQPSPQEKKPGNSLWHSQKAALRVQSSLVRGFLPRWRGCVLDARAYLAYANIFTAHESVSFVASVPLCGVQLRYFRRPSSRPA